MIHLQIKISPLESEVLPMKRARQADRSNDDVIGLPVTISLIPIYNFFLTLEVHL